jgi:Phage tail lysozyme
VWRALLADGLSRQAAGGVLGNLQQESSLDPTDVQADGPGMGLAQWSRGERWDGPGGLVPWAKAHGMDEWSLQAQVTWLLKEMHQGWGTFDDNHFRTMSHVIEATIYFHATFEVSADSPQFVRQTRGGFAMDWYRRLHGTAAPAQGAVFVAGDSLTIGSGCCTALDSPTGACVPRWKACSAVPATPAK